MQANTSFRFQWQLSPIYEKSEVNPEAAYEQWGKKGPLLAAMEIEDRNGWEVPCPNNMTSNHKRKDWFGDRNTLIADTSSYQELEKLWGNYCAQKRQEMVRTEIQALVVVEQDNPYEQILNKATLENLDWLVEYKLAIAEEEMAMLRFWFQQPKDKLKAMAERIVNAFFHGFISQSRSQGDRRRVRFYYQVGQEPLAKQVLIIMKQRGLRPVISRPKSMYERNQFALDHQYDLYWGLNKENGQEIIKAWEAELKKYEKELKDTCGMIGIDQFGQKPDIIFPSQYSLRLTDEQLEIFYEINRRKLSMEAEYIKPGELSFCKITFPNILFEAQFPEIFKSFFELNMMESEEYELEQQKLIDVMDLCEKIEIKGIKGNQTDLTVQLFPISNPLKQTKFLNCGGDLNIPFGEVFTTPKLRGTEGILHIPKICLKGIFYHNMYLKIQDGIIIEANCDEGEAYIKRNLLHDCDQVSFGEFAIGTNTYAATLNEKYHLDDRLPILIYEKTGPHLAVGDACFARAEDYPIFNMYDQKEMVCRQNEALHFYGENKHYYGFHTDITLPYHQILYLRGVTKQGKYIKIIEKGRFVMPGIEKLNQGFEGI